MLDDGDRFCPSARMSCDGYMVLRVSGQHLRYVATVPESRYDDSHKEQSKSRRPMGKRERATRRRQLIDSI
jgi:hypothetical protein